MKARDVIINLKANVRSNRDSGDSLVPLNDLEHHLDLLEAEIAEEELKQLDLDNVKKLEQWRQLLAAEFVSKSTYTALLMLVGYAAFLTVWANVQRSLADDLAAYSLMSIIVSALIYILFEGFSQLRSSALLKSNAALFISKPEEFLKRKELELEKLDMQKLRKIRLWHFAFFLSSVFAALATGILFYAIFLSSLV